MNEKQRNRTGRVDGEARDALINSGVAALTAMRVTSMSPQRADAFDGGCKTAQNLAHIVGDQWIDIGFIWGKAQRLPYRIK